MSTHYAKDASFPADVALDAFVDALADDLIGKSHGPAVDAAVGEFFEKDTLAAAPLGVLRLLWVFVKDVNANNVIRNQRLAELEARCKALEERPPITYKGTWQAGEVIRKGELVTCSGSLWYARNDSMLKPGDGEDAARDFVLVAKRGRDGKDLR